MLPTLPRLRGLSPAERAVTLVQTLDAVGPEGHTTNLVTLDSDGNACVLTTSLGLGSGDFLPGLDVHLNSMLGEADLIRGALEPGSRMGSMMAPSLAFDADGLVFAGGAAGGTRLRSALVQVVAGILDEGLEPDEAVVAAPAPSGRRARPSRAGLPRRGSQGTCGRGPRGSRLAGAASLLRRSQRRYAKRRRG